MFLQNLSQNIVMLLSLTSKDKLALRGLQGRWEAKLSGANSQQGTGCETTAYSSLTLSKMLAKDT